MRAREELTSAAAVISVANKYSDSKALRRVIELAYRSGARAVVVQELQSDEQFDSEVRDLQKRGEPGYSKPARRLDFVLENGASAVHFGYAIIRPDARGTVLRAVVPPPPENPGSYLTCSHDWDCDTSGLEDMVIGTSKIHSCSFTQQDGNTGVCAHACLHSVSRALHARFDSDILSFSQISDFMEHDEPRDGLSFGEMKRVLESLGCEVLEVRTGTAAEPQDADSESAEKLGGEHNDEDRELSRARREPFFADELIYHYVESELPVIVGIASEPYHHTFFVVGHSFDRDAWWPEAESDYYPSLSTRHPYVISSLWATSYYIQDDNYGPYMSMPRDVARARVDWILVPLPKSMNCRLKAEEVEPYVAFTLYDEKMIEVVEADANTCPWKWELAERQRERRVLLRTLIVKGENLRESLTSAACTYSDDIKERYRKLEMPGWVWVVEVTAASFYAATMTKLGEVILDPGADRIDNFSAVISMHLPGMFWERPGENDYEYVDGDNPSVLYSRKSFSEHAKI